MKKSNRKNTRVSAKLKSPFFLWITDPWKTLDHARDTTLRLAQEALEMGIPQFWCDVKSIRLETQRVCLDALPIVEFSSKDQSIQLGKVEIRSPQDFKSLHYRTDPPVDSAYLHPLQLLALGLGSTKKSEMVNPFNVLFSHNEKVEAAALGKLMAPSLVSSQWERIRHFGESHGRTVLKPLHEAQSKGIELLDWKYPGGIEDIRSKLEHATQNFSTPIILQQYLAGISDGETRLWFLDGKLLSYVKKLPLKGDFRVDIDRGSQLAVTTLSKREKQISVKIGRHLQERKIRLAAVDLIENFVTDFNFTSPGLIRQMESTLGVNLAKPIIKALLRGN